MTYRSIDDILAANNRRRQSQKPEDRAYMAHWNAAKRSTCQGTRPCSVFGLCDEGERLDAICLRVEAQDAAREEVQHAE